MRALPSPSICCRLAALAVGLVFVAGSQTSRAEATVTIGDSLTAEYEFPEPGTVIEVPEFSTEDLEYARVEMDHPDWVSRSWVEILGQSRPFFFDFGRVRKWGVPRFGGFEYNWAVPGARASQYEDFMTEPLVSNPLLFSFRLQLENHIRARAKRVVIWLGTNDLREKYGEIYAEDNATERLAIVNALKAGLLEDLELIVDRVKSLNRNAEIVVVNLPDLGAAPQIVEDHPNDPPQEGLPETTVRKKFRGWVTTAIEAINTEIAELAEDEEIVVADVYQITKDLIAHKPFYYGAILFRPGTKVQENELEGGGVEKVVVPIEPDQQNNPHSLFTRDSFHPNTALQIQIARTIIKAFNDGYDARIPSITQAEALKLLKISAREPYNQWVAENNPSDIRLLKDPDGDGMSNLFEYAFDMNPALADADQLVPDKVLIERSPQSTSVTYQPIAGERRDLNIAVQYKFQGRWFRVLSERVVNNGDGTFTATVPPGILNPKIRIKVTLVPPQGSLNTVVTAFRPVEETGTGGEIPAP